MEQISQDSKDLANAVYEGMCDLRVSPAYEDRNDGPPPSYDFTYAFMDKLSHSSYAEISPVDEKYLWLRSF